MCVTGKETVRCVAWLPPGRGATSNDIDEIWNAWTLRSANDSLPVEAYTWMRLKNHAAPDRIWIRQKNAKTPDYRSMTMSIRLLVTLYNHILHNINTLHRSIKWLWLNTRLSSTSFMKYGYLVHYELLRHNIDHTRLVTIPHYETCSLASLRLA